MNGTGKTIQEVKRSRRELPFLVSSWVRSTTQAMNWLWQRAAYTLSLLPLFTDWIDTGHWPAHPRELATELVIGVLILVGVALLYRRADHFKRLAEVDPLTGLGNRLRFRNDIEAAVASSHESAQPLSLAFIDVDRFKQINDGWGHDAGDEALRQVAHALERSIRQGIDSCYRFGGDEFAILLSGSEGNSVLAALQRSFDKVSTRRGITISCSVGIVSLQPGETPGSMIQRADELMYAAKRGVRSTTDCSASFFGKVGDQEGSAALRIYG
jgi:diguanylate cyclase (GGDEF)-like protein